ncbi:Hypothetical protein CINCED_3A012974, partial [Cinara cedri]
YPLSRKIVNIVTAFPYRRYRDRFGIARYIGQRSHKNKKLNHIIVIKQVHRLLRTPTAPNLNNYS